MSEKCVYCGTEVAKPSHRNGMPCLCQACIPRWREQQTELRYAEWDKTKPLFCVVCGKQVKWNRMIYYHRKTRAPITCSNHCKMLRVQSNRKETKEHLEERLIAFCKAQGKYTSLATVRTALKLSDKLLYTRGISMRDINRRAGYRDGCPANAIKDKAELTRRYIEVLREAPDADIYEVAKRLDVSVAHILSLGIKASDIRKQCGIYGLSFRSNDEIIAMLQTKLKEIGCYTPLYVLAQLCHIDYKSSVLNRGITNADVCEPIGFYKPRTSYFEPIAFKMLKESFSDIAEQKSFASLKSDKGWRLRFDFCLEAHKILIEVDGDQHYSKTALANLKRGCCGAGSDGADAAFNELRNRDRLKAEWASANGYVLYRIPTSPAKTFVPRLISLIAQIKQQINGRNSGDGVIADTA